ncbi:MAG: twin-arginine translocase TatA/TatE family subunit [Polyangiales bacterium]|nr:twin-arginine translocase TatA/TatE family subunit [Myxococcales bacterium]
MPNIGFGELVIILLIVLMVFGARRLPQIGEGIGKAISGLKRGLNSNDDIEVSSEPKRVPESSSAEGMPKQTTREADVVEKK